MSDPDTYDTELVVVSNDDDCIIGRKYSVEDWEHDTFRVFDDELDDLIEQLQGVADDD